MQKEFTHPLLGEEVRSVSGFYMVEKETRLFHEGRAYLVLVASGYADTACCGVGGCRYALVPGEVLVWKGKTDTEGRPVSAVLPVTDPELRAALSQLVMEQEGVLQAQFL
jgi:hypothetical protein